MMVDLNTGEKRLLTLATAIVNAEENLRTSSDDEVVLTLEQFVEESIAEYTELSASLNIEELWAKLK